MNLKNKLVENETMETLSARYNLGLLLVAFWILILIQAYLTFPFVGHTSKIQNVTYGLIVGIPFLIISAVFLILGRKDIIQYKNERSDSASRKCSGEDSK